MLKTVQLGRNSGLRVSQLCLGTMNFGEPGQGHQGDWTLGVDDARPIFRAAVERELAAKGMTKAEGDEADAIIAFTVGTKVRFQVQGGTTGLDLATADPETARMTPSRDPHCSLLPDMRLHPRA